MPNWCSNVLELEHEDPAMIDRAYRAFKDGRLLDEFIPVPADLKETVSGFFGDEDKQRALNQQNETNLQRYGYANWFDFCVSEWGTKWDVGGNEDCGSPDDGRLTLSFDSAWSPPIQAYQRLTELGFNVRAYYYESGCAFCGTFESEYGDECWNISDMNWQQVQNSIPDELDEMFGISESMRSWEEENEE